MNGWRIMRDPAFKEKCLAEKPVKLAGEGSSVPPIADTMIAAIELVANKFFPPRRNAGL